MALTDIRRLLFLVAALAVAGALACFSERSEPTATGLDGECPGLPLSSEAFGSVVVAIRDFAFHPDTVRVAPGTRVTWIDCEPASTAEHTTTSDAGVWDSPLLGRGGTYSRTFDEEGTFPYHCEPHPFMKAAVIVE